MDLSHKGQINLLILPAFYQGKPWPPSSTQKRAALEIWKRIAKELNLSKVVNEEMLSIKLDRTTSMGQS